MSKREPDYADCLSASWLGERLGGTPSRVEAMRREGELLAVRRSGSVEWLYPAWQFDGWAPRRGVARIVAAARDAELDESTLYELLTAPLGMRGTHRSRLADLLVAGREDEVVAAVRSA